MKKKRYVINAAKLIYIVLIFCTSYYLFYNQAFTVNRLIYLSDLPDHIALALAGNSYSFMYIIMGTILKLPGDVFVLLALETLLVLGAGWIGYLLLKELLSDEKKDIAFFVAFTLLFLTSIYLPKVFEWYYAGTFVTQPWHNITYIGMRFFALWTMYNFFKIYRDYLEGISFKEWLKVAIPLLLATAIKPNFLLSFAFALLVILLIDFLKDYNHFWNIVKLGTAVFPACVVLLIQAVILYGPNDEGSASSVIITWGGSLWEQGLDVLLLKILCGLAFPILICICNYKQFDKNTKFVYLMFLVTFIQMHFLEETGVRAAHGNFTWGIYCAAYMLFIYAVGYFIKNFDFKGKKMQTIMGCVFLALHFISGCKYFMLLLQGEPSHGL